MACNIKIDSVVGVGNGPTISVMGTMEDCATGIDGGTVIVRLSCGSANNRVATINAEVHASGIWYATFDGVEGQCRCGGDVFVTAECATDSSCSDSFTGKLDCIEVCPPILLPGDDAGSQFVTSKCNPDGTANVTITLEFTNTTSSLKFLRLIPGPDATEVHNPVTGFLGGANDEVDFLFQYPTPSTPSPILVVLTEPNGELTGCPPFEIDIPPLESCRQDCPLISAIEVEIGDCENDPDVGYEKRRVTFSPTVTGPTPTAHVWEFGDGESQLGAGAPNAISHLYEGVPIFKPSLCVVGPNECEDACLDVPLSEFDNFETCVCPVIDSISVTIGDCISDPDDGKQKRKVTFSPTITGPAPTSHIWNFGDGSSDLSGGAPGSIEHLYEFSPTTQPQLCISGPEPCSDSCQDVAMSEFDGFESCSGSIITDDDESFGCGALRIGVAIAAALTILAILLAICVPAAATALIYVAIGAVIITVILAVVYSIFCPNKPCKVALLISGQSSLAAGVAALVLSACCPWVFWAGLGLTASGLGLLMLWRSQCGKSYCEFAKEVVKVLGAFVLPILGILVGIPVISVCFSGVALAGISAVFGPVTVYASTC